MKKILWIVVYAIMLGLPNIARSNTVNLSDPRYGRVINPYPGQTLYFTSEAQSFEITTDAAPDGIPALLALQADLNRKLEVLRNPGIHVSLEFEDGDRCYITFHFDEFIYGESWRRVNLGSDFSIVQYKRGSDYSERPAATQIEVGLDQRPSITLQNTTVGKVYPLMRNGQLIATKTATGSSLTFDNLPLGTATYLFAAAASYPIEVWTVSLFSTKLYASNGYSVRLPESGGVSHLNLYSAASERSLTRELSDLCAKFNAGEYDYWNSDIKISVEDRGISGSNHNYRFTLTAGPNLASGTITNYTRLGNQAGSEFIIRQDGGGSLQRPGEIIVDSELGRIKGTVTESQHLVTYKLFWGNYLSGTTTGNGGDISLTTPIADGDYELVASYKDDSKVLCTTRILGGKVVTPYTGNWILETTYTDQYQNVADITYYDGLGYRSQYIQIDGSPAGDRDLIQPFYYDKKLRESRSYLPYTRANNSGQSRPDPISEQGSSRGTYAYSEELYDNSPLDRVTRSYQPGSEFRSANKAATYSYDLCEQGEVLRLDVDNNHLLTVNGYYPQASLYKNTQTDEDGATTIRFTDMQGRTILIRALAEGANADTYHAYNLMGQLCWILSPEGSIRLVEGEDHSPHSDFAQDHCYVYKYDGRGNLVEKQVPGAGPEYMVYDHRDLLVYRQNALLREDLKWIRYNYDNSKRPVSETVGSLEMSREQLQARVDTGQNPVLGNQKILHTWGYDGTYDWPPYRQIYGVTTTDDGEDLWAYEQAEERLCFESLRALDSNEWVSIIYYYDAKGRVIQTGEEYPDGIVYNSTKYDFTGKVIKKHQEFLDNSSYGGHTLWVEYTYDDRGRLLREHTSFDETSDIDVTYEYDDLGRLTSKSFKNFVGNRSRSIRVMSDIWMTYGRTTWPGGGYYRNVGRVLRERYGIENWDEYNYFDEDDNINPAYYIGYRNNNPNNKYYYFPEIGIDAEELQILLEDVYVDYAEESGSTLFVRIFVGAGEPKTHVELQGDAEAGTVTETFAYNLPGWRTGHELTKGTQTLYTSNLYYYNPTQSASTPSYTGNISEWEWQHRGADVPDSHVQLYCLTYDPLGRIEEAYTYSDGDPTNSYAEFPLYYDLNGNPEVLLRTKSEEEFCTANVYNYVGNKLMVLEDHMDNVIYYNYAYDAAGNMIRDGKNGLDLTYNYLNLTEKVERDGATLAKYSYLSDGRKLSVVDGSGEGLVYRGSFIYRKTSSDLEFESSGFNGGRFVANAIGDAEPQLFITDHLGSVRVVMDRNGEILERNNYYPFGMKWQEPDVPTSDNRYRFNGKEEQDFLGLPYTDYGARQYDPDLIRWNGVDALAGRAPNIGSYVFCMNNPINRVDPDGRWSVSNHYKMTMKGLRKYSIKGSQAALLAHYSSVYADNPGPYILANNIAHPGRILWYLPGIDYRGVANSQSTNWQPGNLGMNNNIRHSMRSDWEADAYERGLEGGISQRDAQLRGMQYGWNNIFKSAKQGKLKDFKKNSQGIQQFGVGLHALQDGYGHAGVSMGEHRTLNDVFGNKESSQIITESAIFVHKLLSGDWDNLGDIKKLDFTGMSDDQKTEVVEKLKEWLNQ